MLFTAYQLMEKFKNWLIGSEKGSILGLYRVLFGLMMVYQTWYYHSSGLLTAGLTNPFVHFHFDGLGFLNPLPLPAMQVLLALMGISALLIAAGYFFRIACAVLTAIHAYLLLIDISIFNNHIYLFILVSFLFAFTDADRFFSLSGNRGYGANIPRWQIFILQLQLGILYFYGGLAKIGVDWLVYQEPLQAMLDAINQSNGPWAMFLKNFPTWFFSYGGLLIDLLIPFLLWDRRTRYWSVIPLFFFHFSNSTIYKDIGIFPYFAILTTVIFFQAEDFKKFKWLRFLQLPKLSADPQPPSQNGPKPWARKLLVGFFIFQILFPLRWLLLPNDVDYTMVANRFSWRMKSHARHATRIEYTVENPATGTIYPVGINTYINTMQISLLSLDARAPVVFAKFLANEVRQKMGIPNPIVRANIKIVYNGRPEQYFIDPHVDLSKVEYSPFKKINWTVPPASLK